METISNIANAASKAIFGEGQTAQSHEEPVSGKMGNVAAGEPYDAGNIEPNEAALSSAEKKETETPATETKVSTSNPASEANKPPIATTTTGTSLPQPMPKPEPEAATKPRFVPVEEQKQPQTTTTGVTSSAGPAATAPSATSMREDSTKAQNDTRPPPPSSETATEAKPQQVGAVHDIPGTSKGVKTSGFGDTSLASRPDTTKDTVTPAPAPVTDETKDKTKEKTDLSKPSDDEPAQNVKLEGPGPRPLEEIAREHGGDAGAAKPEAVSGAAPGAGGAAAPGEGVGEGVAGQQQQQRRDSGKGLGEDEGRELGAGKMGGAPGGVPGAGTGEQYVKSSGLAADGGDFDASRPGAGKEADRLLEQKGVHKDAPGAHHHEAGGKEKVGLKDKIKAKLHKNTMSS